MIITAFTLGFFGSLHCLGMCGPLAMAIPFPKDNRVLGIITYNMGRVVTYSIFGLILGSIGSSLSFSGLQKGFALAAGIMIFLLVLIPGLSNLFSKGYQQSVFMSWIKKEISNRFQKKTLTTSFVVGVLNGFLPCGLVYVALAGALATGKILSGSLFMIAFGLGTFPAMISLCLAPGLLKFKVQSRFIVPGISLVLAILFLYRGLAIELPVVDHLLLEAGLNNIAVCK